MRIENFSIIDFKNFEAANFRFGKGNNLIISDDNTQGKSSLLKSMYYTLGFDVRQFPSGWNYKDMYFQLEVEIDRNQYTITRQNDIYRVNDVEGSMTVKEYSMWLQEKLDLDMRLLNTRTRELFQAYSSAVILPFYIDQDDSWSEGLYRNVSDTLNQYANIPVDIFKSAFSLSSLKLLELQNEKTILTKEKKTIALTIDGLTNAFKEYQEEREELPEVSKFDKEKLEKDIQRYLKIQNQFNDSVIKYKVKLLAKNSELDRHEQDVRELKQILKMTQGRKREIQSECNYCHSKLTTEQSLTRLDLSNNEMEISLLKDEYEKIIDKLKMEISSLEEGKEQLNKDIENIRFNLNQSRELLTVEDYVDASAKMKASEELRNLLDKQVLIKNALENKIKELNKTINKMQKATKELEREIEKKYDTLIVEMKKDISNLDIDEAKFLKFNSIPGSGIDNNKKRLGHYLVYVSLLKKYSNYKIPFCMDSFIKNEISDASEVMMFEAINKYFFDEENQTFFSIISKNVKNLNQETNYHKTNLSGKLLSKEKYEEIKVKFIFE